MKKKYSQAVSAIETEEQGTRLLKFFEILIEIDQKNRKRIDKPR